MNPAILRDGEGAFELLDWTPEMSRALDDLARLADPGTADPAVRARLFPDEGEGEREREEWRRHAHPELETLFASAREVVLADLRTAVRGRRRSIRRLVIPPGHVPAWVGALNTARLSLASAHGVDADAMGAEPQDLGSEVRDALVRISLFGELQWALLAPAESWPEDEPGAA